MDANIKTIARVLVEQVETVAENEVSDVMKEFVSYLAENKMLGSWRDIEAEIHNTWREKFIMESISQIIFPF